MFSFLTLLRFPLVFFFKQTTQPALVSRLCFPRVCIQFTIWVFLQVQSDYDRLRQTFAVVSQERDVAQEQRSQLEGKVNSLEQVLKVGQIFALINEYQSPTF